jgi:hypothetical protein
MLSRRRRVMNWSASYRHCRMRPTGRRAASEARRRGALAKQDVCVCSVLIHSVLC